MWFIKQRNHDKNFLIKCRTFNLVDISLCESKIQQKKTKQKEDIELQLSLLLSIYFNKTTFL